MIRSSDLLRCYSEYIHPERSRIVYDNVKPLETVFENSEEFEELMLSLYLMDRFVSSENTLSFETNYPVIWREEKQKIEMLFEFLTKRKISLKFVNRSNPKRELQKRLNHSGIDEKNGVICLFSGGLDSAAGSVELIKNGCNLALSHTATGHITLGRAKALLKNPTLSSTPMIVTDMRIKKDSSLESPSSNTRGFLFISNALVIASCLKYSQVCIPENGPLMINPNISSGSEATKNAHPFLITSLEEIYNRVANTKIKINSLFKDLTKAEISAKLGNNKIIDHTWSCFNVQGQSRMCGACFACLVRRLSLVAAGYYEPPETYENNPFSSDLESSGGALNWKLDDIHDTFVYLRDFYETKKFSKNEMFYIPDGFFQDEREMMNNFALDMFLGFAKEKEKLGSENLGSLGKFVKKIVDKIPNNDLNQRENELVTLNPGPVTYNLQD